MKKQPTIHSGQISIIPKPELRALLGDSLTKPQFKVASAEVVIICPDPFVNTEYPPGKRSHTPVRCSTPVISTIRIYISFLNYIYGCLQKLPIQISKSSGDHLDLE